MKQLWSVFRYSIPVILFLMQIDCTPDLAGATTETTNGVTGKLHNQDNTPAAAVIVKLFAEDYDPLKDNESLPPVLDTTDKNGTFRFGGITPGGYSVFALDSIAATAYYAGKISIEKDSMTTITDGKLEATGAVITDFSASEDVGDNDYIYLPGTDLYSYIGNTGTALLNSVPVGKFSELILVTSDGKKRNILKEDMSVTSEDTVAIINPLWQYHLDIFLNTTPSGADMAADIPDFPVLIRLNNENFDFEQAMPDGGDLLFVNTFNVPLAFEIEQWSAEDQIAVIWVKIDTVYGNNNTQSIRMYWGNTDALPMSNSTTVFDTSNGYQGVWHLDDSENVEDATYNRFEGGSPDSARPQLSEGIIGSCRNFDGTDDFITMPNTADGKLDFSEDAEFTVSAWVHLAAFDNSSHCIVSKGAEQYFLRSTYVGEMTIVEAPLWEFVEFSENDKWQILTSPASDGEWVFLTGVCQGDHHFLYCNGELVDSSLFLWPNDEVARDTSNDLYLGRFAEELTLPPLGPMVVGYNHFKGSIDEVRILSKSQSADWVRLCYMNQRSDDRLVQFK